MIRSDMTWIAMRLTEEQIMIQNAARQLADQSIRPNAIEWDQNKIFPKDAINELSQSGFMGMLVPEKWNGSQIDHVSYALVIEEIAKAHGATSTIVAVHNSVACMPILNFGTESQKEEFLKPLASGKKLGAFCLTEPQAGSDAKNLATKAIKKNNHFILNGVKQFVTSGKNADIAIVMAKTSETEISAFIVPTNTNGFNVSKLEDKMGQRASEVAQIVLEDVKIPIANLLGNEGEGYKIALSQLECGRIGIAAQALGMAQEALDITLQYTTERKTFNRPLYEHQAIQFKLADMATNLQAARLLIHHAADLKDNNLPAVKAASQAKLYATEKAAKICHMALEIHGGYGYLCDYPLEKIYRDVLVTTIYEGTSDIQRHIICREMLKEVI
jgi:butyryl-CoA dehydrogenase